MYSWKSFSEYLPFPLMHSKGEGIKQRVYAHIKFDEKEAKSERVYTLVQDKKKVKLLLNKSPLITMVNLPHVLLL